MKRLLVLAAAVAGGVAFVGTQPVKADDSSAGSPAENATLSAGTINAINQIIGDLPAPAGWQPRHACFGVDWINFGECITFPFPT